MKAEHRKELHTNALADRLGKLFETTKGSSSAIWWVLLLVVALGVGFWWYTARTTTALTAEWAGYWQGREALADENLAKQFQGTAVQRVAELAEADKLFASGYNTFFSTPADARKKFADASALYEKLTGGGDADITVRALLGAGQSQEWLGDSARAKHFYAEVGTRFAKHALASDAAKRIDELDRSAAFYTDWTTRLPEITHGGGPKPPPLPPGK